MIVNALWGHIQALIRWVLEPLPIVTIPAPDLTPVTSLFSGVASLLPMWAFQQVLAAWVALAVLQLGLIVWRWLRTGGAP